MTPLNDSQKDLLIKLAEQLHIKVEVINDEDLDIKNIQKLAESSFAKEWESEEDAHWDEFLKSTADVSKR
ncbi:MAG: hypothetical protein JWO03_432 [Bacteroidetes bacterium]|nr:hypothetical protein [Bacteroidota bacterium]